MPLSHKESIGLYPAPADDKEVIIGRDGKGGFHLIRRLVCRLSAGQALPLKGKPTKLAKRVDRRREKGIIGKT